MQLKKLLLIALLTIVFNKVHAHALWIETAPAGLPNKTHDVKVFFGEYASNERDTTAKWFSNLRDFTLWLTAPSGKKKQLATVANIDYCLASFTPDEQGIYTLSITIEVRDTYRKSKIQYYCNAVVHVGASNAGSSNIVAATDLSLQVKTGTVKKQSPITLSLFLKNKTLAKTKITVATSTGFKKDLETDENGSVTFTPQEAGTYMLEGFHIVNENGMQNGKEYTSVFHCITHCVYVNK